MAEGGAWIRVPKPGDPEHSIAQEPSIQNLPDGRMICLLRTLTGYAWWSVSEDAGESWSEAEVLRFASDGRPVPHPISPCPLYRLSDGRYLLIFHNNVGTAHGGEGPHDSKRNRRPRGSALGRCGLDGGQPLAFSEPRVLTDNDGVELPPEGHTQVATYGSLFEHEDGSSGGSGPEALPGGQDLERPARVTSDRPGAIDSCPFPSRAERRRCCR